jgi:hypothetical protein
LFIQLENLDDDNVIYLFLLQTSKITKRNVELLERKKKRKPTDTHTHMSRNNNNSKTNKLHGH